MLAVVGVVLWNRANSLEDEAANSPNRTRMEVDHLLDLEARGDRYALWGNVAVVGGVALAGVGAYLYWRNAREAP